MDKTMEFKGKTFRDVIEQMDCRVKVGSANGSSFWYIGPAKAVTMYKMLELDAWVEKTLGASVKHQEHLLNILMANFPTPEAYVAREYEKDETFGSFEGYMALLEHHFARLYARKEGLEKALKAYDSRIPVSDRKVVSVYPSTDTEYDEDVYIILVEGAEKGFAWFETEYLNGGEAEVEDE